MYVLFAQFCWVVISGKFIQTEHLSQCWEPNDAYFTSIRIFHRNRPRWRPRCIWGDILDLGETSFVVKWTELPRNGIMQRDFVQNDEPSGPVTRNLLLQSAYLVLGGNLMLVSYSVFHVTNSLTLRLNLPVSCFALMVFCLSQVR